ncbi:hypothetical protein NQ318_006100 [Aromia moschata]|uniref:Uncharacterized protein n=1 Tax=Aromia moschata TaxID=1265417 RepID=A0AAV8Z3L1_9CUCU|nr:hypothetical protein NQ318_006100 [Aromia moschata]
MIRFESVEAVKAKATEVLNQLTEADFSTAFNNGKVVWSGVEMAKGSTLKAKKVATSDEFWRRRQTTSSLNRRTQRVTVPDADSTSSSVAGHDSIARRAEPALCLSSSTEAEGCRHSKTTSRTERQVLIRFAQHVVAFALSTRPPSSGVYVRARHLDLHSGAGLFPSGRCASFSCGQVPASRRSLNFTSSNSKLNEMLGKKKHSNSQQHK